MNKKNKRINSAKNKIRKEVSEKKYLFSWVCGIRHIGYYMGKDRGGGLVDYRKKSIFNVFQREGKNVYT